MRRMAEGDPSALAWAYDAHGALVYGLALRVTGRREEAEEVLQDVFLTLWRTADRFDRSRGSLPAYLAALTRNRAIDRIRARGARPDLAPSLDASDSPATAASPADAVAGADAAGRARAALVALPPDERRVLEMAYFDGLSQSEIAARTGDPLGTVKGRTRSGLARLRALLPASLGGTA